MALCEICGSDSLRCSCATHEPYCDQCNESDKCNAEMDSACVIYHPRYPGETTPPSKLQNLGIANGASAQTIFEAIDGFLGNNANVSIKDIQTHSIKLTTSGIAKHTIKADLNISPDINNQLEVRQNGVYAKPYNEHFYVKVNALDVPDYLENQITGGTDKIVSISIQQEDGLLSIQPTLNLGCLIDALANSEKFIDLICTIKRACEDKCADILDIDLTVTTT